LVSKVKAKTNGKVVTKPPRASAAQIGETSDSDVPLNQKLVKQKQKIEKAAEKEAKQIRKDEKNEASKPSKKAAPPKKSRSLNRAKMISLLRNGHPPQHLKKRKPRFQHPPKNQRLSRKRKPSIRKKTTRKKT
jgi:hypothetical protein